MWICGTENLLYEWETLGSLPASGTVLRSRLEDSSLAWISGKVDGPATGWRMERTGWSGILDWALFVVDCVALDQAPSFSEPL
jgi:hypothetical protein